MYFRKTNEAIMSKKKKQCNASYHHGPLQILLLHPACTEQVSVCKVLCCHITDGQLGQNHLGSRLIDLLQFVIQDVPLCVHDGLVVLQEEEKQD